ncbi:hypothetical protein GCM10022221_55680 [Actinocorallia aurea]
MSGCSGASAAGATIDAETTTAITTNSVYWFAVCPEWSEVTSGVEPSAIRQIATTQPMPGELPTAALNRFGRSARTARAMPTAKYISDLGSRCSL